MALAGVLCVSLFTVTGFTNGSLRALVARLLGAGYTTRQMSYDLRQLRLHGLIHRIEGRHHHVLTDGGRKCALFYTNSATGSSAPSSTPTGPTHDPDLVQALDTIDTCLNDSFTDAGLARAT